MPLLLPILGVSLLLALTSSSAAKPARGVPDPVCPVVVVRLAAGTDPPAWLLLAGAVLVLGAGRVAAS